MRIPEQEITVSFVRSSGPGGQNVNKTSTKAQLRWNIGSSLVFTNEEKAWLRQKLANRLTKDDDIILSIEDQRSQSQNKERAISLLQDLVDEALTPEKPRIPTKIPRSAKRARLQVKTRRSRVKQLRKDASEE